MKAKPHHLKTFLIINILVTGCVGGGYNNPNLTGYGASGNSMLGAIENVAESALLGPISQSVLNGQISSQIPQTDQNYRIQQLNNMVQSGVVNQSQQWTNPQTGSAFTINPVGQNAYSQQYQQHCQSLQEAVTLPSGQQVTENRLACLNPQTGQWALVQ